MSQILNSTQVAEMLGCTPRTVEEHARSGTLKATKFGESWIFLSDMVIEGIRAKCEAEAEQRRKPAVQSVSVAPVSSKRKRQLPTLVA